MVEKDFRTNRLVDVLDDLNLLLEKLIKQKDEQKGIFAHPDVDFNKILKETRNLTVEQDRQNRDFIMGYKMRYELILDFYKKYGSLLRNYGKKYADEAIKIFPQYSEIADTEINGIKGYFLNKIKEQDLYSIVMTYYYGALDHYGTSARSFMLKILSDLRSEDFGKNFYDSKKSFKEIDNIFNQLSSNYNNWQRLVKTTGDISLANTLVYGSSEIDALSYLTDIDNQLKKISLEYEGKELSFFDISKMSFEDFSSLSKPVKTLYENLKSQLSALQNDLLGEIEKSPEVANLGDKFKNIYDYKISNLEVLLNFGVIDNNQFEKYKEIFGKEFQENLSNVNRELIQLDEVWKTFFDLENKSFGQLREAFKYAEQLLNNSTLSPKSTDNRTLYDTFYIDENNLKRTFEVTKGELKQISEIYFKILKYSGKKNPFLLLYKSLKEIFGKEKVVGGEIIPKNWQEIFKDLGTGLGAIAALTSSITSDFSKMFSSLGDVKTARIFSDLSSVLSGVSSAAFSFSTGNLIGGIAASFGVVTGFLTSIFEKHDAELQKQIEESQRVVKKLQQEREAIERAIDRGLGGAYGGEDKGGAYIEMLQKLRAERAELEEQYADAKELKDDDEREQAMSDIENEMAELDDQIRYLAEDTLAVLMEIDLKGWASQIGDALVDAFANGEDAVAAFDQSVGEMIKSVVKNMASLYIIEPMMEDLRRYLFGEDGRGGVFGSDYYLDADELAGMKEYLDVIREKGIPAVKELYEGVDAATGGIMSAGTMEGLSAGIKSVTEDTANLLASYLNAVRADVALIASGNPRMTTIAEAQLVQLNAIALNTSRNALAAESINELLRSVTTTTPQGRVLKV